MTVKSFGECMVEFDQELNQGIAGDTFNTCATTAMLGMNVEYSMRIAKDIFYNDFVETFSRTGVNTQLIEDHGKNGIYFISNDTMTGERSFQYYRENSSASKLCFDDLGPNYLDTCEILYNSGITAALSENLRDALLKTYSIAKSKNKLTIFDVNYREKLWSIIEAKGFLKEIVTHVDILIISEDDRQVLEEIHHPFSIERNGAGSVTVRRNDEVDTFNVPSVKAIDTSGAGDVFTGAFIYKYAQEKNISSSVEFAISIAAKHVQYRGAMPRKDILCV